MDPPSIHDIHAAVLDLKVLVVIPTEYTVHKERRLPICGIPSFWKNQTYLVIVGGARPPPFQPITITYKVAVYAPAEWADTLTLFHLYKYMYSVDFSPILMIGSVVDGVP
jgi:hypothetical protein